MSFDQNTPAASVASPLFATKSSQELLLAFVSTDAVTTPNTTVRSVTGGGLAWVLVVRTNTQSGTSEIWRAYAPNPLANVRIYANLSQSVVSTITVESFTGVNISGTNGSGAIGAIGSAHASSGAPTASLVTTQANSLVVGAGNDYDNAIARTPMAGQTVTHQLLTSTGDTYWVQAVTAASTAAGVKVTLGDSAPTSDQYNLSICEIVPSTGVATPQLTMSTTALIYGSVADGTTKSQSVTLTSSGAASVTISSLSVSGTGFSIASTALPKTLSAGQTLAIPVTFAPTAAGAVSGKLTVVSNSTTGATSTVALTGTGVVPTPQLTLSTTALSFGSVADGTTKSLSVTLTSSGTSAVKINSAAVSGTGFSIPASALPATLAVGQSLNLQITFAPVTVAPASGSLTISSNSASGASSAVTLSGTGVAALSPKLALSTTALSFGTVTEGSPTTQSVTLSSTGTSAVTVSSASVSGTGFSLVGAAFPISLSPGATAKLTIQYSPTVAGASTGQLTIGSNSATGSTAVVSLSGTGQAPVTHSVDLSWYAPSSSTDPVVGYHVYRLTSGATAYALLTATIDTTTSYVDNTVVSGTTYSYEVKSVDGSGVESAPSNPYTVTIP